MERSSLVRWADIHLPANGELQLLYERQGEGPREREEELRTEMPTTALVRKAAASLGRNLDEGQASRLGGATHYAFGAAAAPWRRS